MNNESKKLATTVALAFAFASTSALAQAPAPAPMHTEMGRWITQSGNLEVDIAPCGAALCGTIVRVMAGNAMAGPTPAAPTNPALAAPATVSPIGKKLLFDLKPSAGGGYQGRIFNRGDNKTYNSRVALANPDQLKLTIYAETPGDGQVQVWQRAGATAN